MSLSACPDEEGIPWLCKYLKNAQVTLRIIVDINAGLFVQGALVIGEDFE